MIYVSLVSLCTNSVSFCHLSLTVCEPSMLVWYYARTSAVHHPRMQRGPNKERYKPTAGRFGAKKVDALASKTASSEPLIQDVLSAAFLSADTLVTGCQDGSLLVWDVEGSRSAGGGCVIDVSTCLAGWGPAFSRVRP